MFDTCRMREVGREGRLCWRWIACELNKKTGREEGKMRVQESEHQQIKEARNETEWFKQAIFNHC